MGSDMDYIQTLKESFKIFKENKLIWIFNFLASLFVLINSITLPKLGFWACGFFIVDLAIATVSLISIISMYYVIYQATLDNKPKFSNAWSIGRSRFFRIIGLILIYITILLILFVVSFLMSKTDLSQFSWILSLAGLLFSSLGNFGIYAIVINDAKPLKSFVASVLILFNNFLKVMIIVTSFYLFNLLIQGVIIAFLAVSPLKTLLPSLAQFNYSTYQQITVLPLFRGENWLFELLVSPLETIMLILAYLKFTKEIAYPGLEQVNEADDCKNWMEIG